MRVTPHTGETIRFTAPLFIDCTGDGWIGYWAGAEYMYGREDSSKFNENWDQYKEIWSPAIADNRVMGSSVLWRTVDKGSPVAFPEVPWAMDVAGEYSATMGTWKWEYSNNEHESDRRWRSYTGSHAESYIWFIFKCKEKP